MGIADHATRAALCVVAVLLFPFDARADETLAGTRIVDRADEHWAYEAPELPPIPPAGDTTWPRSDIDRLILARLAAADVRPQGDAAPEVLVRRLYRDLVGLPPTYEQVAQFAADPNEEGYLRLVDQLLAAPQFGERWARYWLDVARFADTKGYVFQEDRNYPRAWLYRDWVISAINDDMPYDEFLKYQIAADQFVDREDDDQRRHLAAMGFLTLGRRFINNIHDIIDDRIDVVMRGTMGLTVTCARCHDHKYDPISIEDYYALYGVFASSKDKLEDDTPTYLVDKDKPHDAKVFLRGSPHNRGDQVARGFPEYFRLGQADKFHEGSGRLALAEMICDPQNPLTSRVMVNRVWQHLLGQPLVKTPSDFGLRSEPPVQQALVDYLAASFVADGWSLKRLVRRIVTSSVYRQASEIDPALAESDPDNDLYWRYPRRRLDFEAMRDAMLSVSGRLEPSIGGPSARIEEAASTRRTLYAFIDRQNLPGMFRAFDFASPDTHSPMRPTTTVPQQALYLMNNLFSQQAAAAVAARSAECSDAAGRVAELYRLILSRDPTDDEQEAAMRYVAQADEATLADVAGTWHFGYGEFDPEASPPVRFTPLPHFTGQAWQGGSELPDAELGWVCLNAAGGHPGESAGFQAIRRWTARREMQVSLFGELEHPAKEGNGVRGRIVSSRQGLLGEWTAAHEKLSTQLAGIHVQAGETIDLIIDSRDDISHDSFLWNVEFEWETADGATKGVERSVDGFRGPAPAPLTPWERLAQVLLLSNEFLFTD